METFQLLRDLAAALAAALGMGLLFYRLKQPVIIGYLLAGLIVGPYGLKFVSDIHTIESLADLGVMLLMFALGVEFSISELAPVKRVALIGGSLQVALTIALTAGASHFFGLSLGAGLLLGGMIALSSTIIVLKVLLERGELESAHGKALLGLLVVQDLSVVLMMVVMPNLGDPAKILGWPMLWAVLKAGGFLGLVILLGTRLFPIIMRRVAATRNKELFLLAGIFLCFGTAASSYLIGLSLALGAFIAGIVVSESDHSHQILADVLPMRDLFATLFFVSIGMLINPAFLMGNLPAVLLLVLAIVLGKSLLGFAIARGFGYGGRTALGVGLGLAQIGEFSFVLAKMGEQQGLIGPDLFSLILTGALITIVLTPLLMQLPTPLYLAVARLGWAHPKRPGGVKAKIVTGELTGLVDHVVICGFGRVGHNLGEVLIHNHTPVLVIEMDPNVLTDLRRRGVPCIYGDSSNLAVLQHARLPLAKAVVVTLPDPLSCQLAVQNARRLNAKVDIIARAHRSQDMADLYHLGATEVVQPEFEASLEVIRSTLGKIGYSSREIQRYSHAIRAKRYSQFHDDFNPDAVPDLREALGEADMSWIEVPSDSGLIGHSLRDLDWRRRTGVGVLAVHREGRVIPNPRADKPLQAGDKLLVLGTQDQLAQLSRILPNVPDSPTDGGIGYTDR
ncbi:MAG TPA: cation:proton antiporter [Stenomitos sp.]